MVRRSIGSDVYAGYVVSVGPEKGVIQVAEWDPTYLYRDPTPDELARMREALDPKYRCKLNPKSTMSYGTQMLEDGKWKYTEEKRYRSSWVLTEGRVRTVLDPCF